jgi:hypothetical protein
MTEKCPLCKEHAELVKLALENTIEKHEALAENARIAGISTGNVFRSKRLKKEHLAAAARYKEVLEAYEW